MYIFPENFHDRPLKCCGCCLKSEHHNYCDIDSLVDDKRCLLLVVETHAYLVISTESIQKTVHVMSHDDIQNAVSEG